MQNSNAPTGKREIAQQKLNSARSNLLLMMVFTLVNIILFFAGTDTMLLFSASIPYYLVILGVVTGIDVMVGVCVAVAAVILILYFLCWLLSKKHYGWMIVALVMFVLDCVCMAVLYIAAEDFSGILDVLFHIWILYYLIIGIRYGRQLKTLPEEAMPDGSIQTPAELRVNPVTGWSTPLRRASDDQKFRVLLEAEYSGHHICYRRIKRVNELVIDGNVYDDVEMLMESAHALNATIDGHVFQVGFDGAAHSYLRVDGQTVTRKLRLY